MERGLWLFRTGEDGVKLEKARIQELKNSSRRGGLPARAKIRQFAAPRSAHLFTENPWGMKARRSVQVTEQVDRERWEKILASAFRYVDGINIRLDHDYEENSDTPDDNDHAMVDLSWCVPCLRFIDDTVVFSNITHE